MLTAALKKQLAKVYYDISHPSSYGNADRLRTAFPHVPRQEIVKWLESQQAYTRHRYRRLRFKTNQIYATSLDECWQIDLLDLPKLKKFNHNIRFILVCVDVLSRYAFTRPLNNKTSSEVIRAFRDIFKERAPLRLVADQGREFNNKPFRDFLEKRGITLHFALGTHKASLAERLVRTIKEQIYRVITRTDDKNYIRYLPLIIRAYNARPHGTLGIAPRDVTLDNESLIWKRLYGGVRKDASTSTLREGDYVRLAVAERSFRKIYAGTFTGEIFIVDEVIPRHPTVYRIKDLKGEPIEGTFYKAELQRVRLPES